MSFVVAEIGVNHGGRVQEAIALIAAAKGAGADAAKFQFFSSRKLWGDDRIAELELTFEELRRCADYCNLVGIEFMCTPFGVEELEQLKPLLKRVKIASGCIRRYELLEAACDTDLPLILSTGMSSMGDIDAAVNILGNPTLLQCTSSYPCRLEDVNLRAMTSLATEYNLPVGFSDHTSGITTAIAAAALGATVIEKHFTLDRNAEGPDHRSSITPKEFKAMRMAIGEVEAALGDGVKRVLPCEQKLRETWA